MVDKIFLNVWISWLKIKSLKEKILMIWKRRLIIDLAFDQAYLNILSRPVTTPVGKHQMTTENDQLA